MMIYLFSHISYTDTISTYYTHYFYNPIRKKFVFTAGASRTLHGNDMLYEDVITDIEVNSYRFILHEKELVFTYSKEIYGMNEIIAGLCEKYLLSKILDKI